MMKNYRLLLIYALISIITFSCSKDNNKSRGEGPVNLGDDVILTFEMKVPAPGSTATYAISGEDEHYIDNITAVLFEESAGVEYYRYHTHATTIDNGTSNTKRFRIQVKKSTNGERFRIVALANLPADHLTNIVNDIISGAEDPTTMTKEEFLKRVSFESIGKWNTTSSANFTPLPMWGETPAMQAISSNTTPDQLGTIKLLRSIARVDIGMDMVSSAGNHVSQGLQNFKLETVKIYNASDMGAIAPLVANLSDAPGELKAQKPTLPTGVAVNTPAIAYTKASVADWDKGFIRDIYIAESDVKKATTAQTRTCVILKGYYTTAADLDSGITNTTVPTWYRIDFFKKTIPANPENPIIEYLDILRNCRYHVNITKVSGPGYNSETEALNSLPMNLEADVLIWDEYEGMDDITTDGQYHLVINKNSFEFYKEGRERTLEVYTDFPKGWEVLVADLPSWIELTPQSHNVGDEKTAVKITLDAIPVSQTNPLFEKDGYFVITAGKMKKKIYVHQINQPEITLEVTPTSIVFRKSGSQAKSVTVTTYPTGAVRAVSSTGDIVWASGKSPEDYDGTNVTNFSIQPEFNNLNRTLRSTVTITIESDGHFASKAVTILQLATDLLFNISDKPMTYPAKGGANMSFTVESDAPWQLSTDIASDPETMLTLSTTIEQPGTTPGTVPYQFGLTPNPYYDTERVANIYAKSSDKDFPQQMIEIKQAAEAPTLKLNDLAANATVDFGTPIDNTTQMTVKVTTNSGWVSILNTNHARVTSDWSPTFNLVQAGSTVPTQEISENITIQSQSSYVGMPAAGTEVIENFTIETRNHGTAPMVSRVVTVKRKIQAVWSPGTSFTPAVNTVLNHWGHNVTLTANTNMKWWVGSNVAANVTAEASPYAVNSPLTIYIPHNASWTNPRTVTVSSIQHGDPLVDRVTYTQPGYTLTSSDVTPAGNIPRTGEVYTFATATATSTPNFRVRAWSEGTLETETEKAGVGYRAITVPANASWINRYVVFFFAREGLGWDTPANNHTRIQLGYDLNLQDTNITQGMWIGAEATTAYYINLQTVNGAPVGRAGIFSVPTDPNTTTGTWLLHPDTQGAVPHATNVAIKIPANNTGVNRQLHFFYEKDGYKWEYIKGINQYTTIDLGAGWWTLPGKTIQVTGAEIYDAKAIPAPADLTDARCTSTHGAGWTSVFGSLRQDPGVLFTMSKSQANLYATNQGNCLPGSTLSIFTKWNNPYWMYEAIWNNVGGNQYSSTESSELKVMLFTITCARK